MGDACCLPWIGEAESDSAVNLFCDVGYRLTHVFSAILVLVEELGRWFAGVGKRCVARRARVGVACKICIIGICLVVCVENS